MAVTADAINEVRGVIQPPHTTTDDATGRPVLVDPRTNMPIATRDPATGLMIPFYTDDTGGNVLVDSAKGTVTLRNMGNIVLHMVQQRF